MTTRPLAPRPEAGLWARLLLFLAALSVAFLVCELAVRRLAPTPSGAPSRYRVPHPVFGLSMEPGANFLNPLPEATVRVAYNSRGWRDVERAPAKAEGVFRIAVLGDSFTEGYSVDLEEAFHRRLEERLRGSDRGIEVLSFAVAGYGTLQEYLVYREEARRFSPDLVLLGFCTANDLHNNSRELEGLLAGPRYKIDSRPFLEPRGGAWSLSEVEVGAARKRYLAAREQRDRLGRRLQDRSAFLRLARQAAGRLGGRRERAEAAGFELAVHGIHYCREPAEVTRAWTTTAAILERLRDEARADGARLAVFTTPAPREFDPGHMDLVRRGSPDPSRICQEEAPGNRRLRAVVEELGVPLIDLLPAFRAKANSERLFRRSDRHWNGRGHALAAEIVAQRLENADLLSGSDGS